MSWYMSIDPGIETGWAIWCLSKGEFLLMGCGLDQVGRPPIQPAMRQVIIEIPQVYQASKSKADPNDLITLAVRVGRYAQMCQSDGNMASVNLVHPRQWKGQLPKSVSESRSYDALSPWERDVWEASARKIPLGLWNNVADAVGLGLYASGRVGVQGRPWKGLWTT